MIVSDVERGQIIAAFCEGRQANEGGRELSRNPHIDRPALFDAWIAGWHEEDAPIYSATILAQTAILVPNRKPSGATLRDVWPMVTV